MSSPVIITGHDNPPPGPRPPNTETVLIGNEDLDWGPVALTNFTVDAYGGAGRITIEGNATLNHATLSLPEAGQDLVNTGNMVLTNQSSLTVAGKLTQAPNEQITLANNSHLTLAGSAEGGKIAISSGMLEFAPNPSFLQSCETVSGNCGCDLAFTGKSGAIQFDGITGKLSCTYNASLNDLIVRTPMNGTLGIFRLTSSSPQAYSAREFSVHGNEVLYHSIGH